MKKVSKIGFTLIELLIVISIMAILSIVAFINFKGFSQDQVLDKALGEIQTFLRLAQSNATSSLVCGTQGGASWSVNLKTDKVSIELLCGQNSLQKTLTLDSVQVRSIKGSSCSSEVNLPLTVTYSPLYGNLTMVGSDSCIGSSSTVTINLINLKNNNQKSFNISKGGAIDVQ